MNTYEFHGSFTFILQAADEESAHEKLNEQLGEVLLNWTVESVSGD